MKITCQSNGRAQLRAGGVGAKASFKCSGGRSTISFVFTRAQASQIAHSANLIGSLTLTAGATTEHLSLSLGRSAPAPVYWTSVFGLGCTAGAGGSAQLVAPNFSSEPDPTTIDVRPWLAWYTQATGWQWLGTVGPDQSSWYRWTATPNGVAEWQQPGGHHSVELGPDHDRSRSGHLSDRRV